MLNVLRYLCVGVSCVWCCECAVRSVLAEMVILSVIIIKKQNKFFNDIMVVTCRNMQEVV